MTKRRPILNALSYALELLAALIVLGLAVGIAVEASTPPDAGANVAEFE